MVGCGPWWRAACASSGATCPLSLRSDVERALGSPVVRAASQPGGFSPGSADRVVLADGRRAFVKAVGTSDPPRLASSQPSGALRA